MRWTRKSETGEMYCSVHNADCPLQGAPGDPMVLEVSPNLIPSSWVCPQAVNEIAQFESEAETYLEHNEPDGVGVVIPSNEEEIVADALRMSGHDDMADTVRLDGVESLDHQGLDHACAALEDNQDDLPVEAEHIFEKLMEAAE